MCLRVFVSFLLVHVSLGFYKPGAFQRSSASLLGIVPRRLRRLALAREQRATRQPRSAGPTNAAANARARRSSKSAAPGASRAAGTEPQSPASVCQEKPSLHIAYSY